MIAYLRSDIWVKTCIYQAEGRIHDPRASARLRARFDFGRAVVIGTIQTVVYTLAIAILFVPHVLACIGTRYSDLCLYRKVRQRFHLSTGRWEGAFVATFVALVSIFRTQFSTEAKNYFNALLEAHWTRYRQNIQARFTKRCQDVAASRLEDTPVDEVYRPYGNGGKSYFELLLAETQQKVIKHCNSFNLGAVVEGRYERYEAATMEIDRYVNRHSKKIWELPLTLRDAAIWRIKEAGRLQIRALNFLTKQANDEVGRRLTEMPRKFNVQAFRKGIAQFRQQIRADMTARITQLQKQQTIIERTWKMHVDGCRKMQKQLQAQSDRLARKQQNAQWWASRTFLPKFLIRYVEMRQIDAMRERMQVMGQLNAVNGQRANAVGYIARGAFLNFSSHYMSMEQAFNGLVRGNGKIFRQIDYLARPTWTARLWRQVSPALRLMPSWQKVLEDIFDPDVC